MPQVTGRRIRKLPVLHVQRQTVAKWLLADPLFQHREYRSALVVRDPVEDIEYLALADRTGANRACRRARVQRHRLIEPRSSPQAFLPSWIEMRARLDFHPGCERFVEPDLFPRRGGDQVAEPLMRDLVRDDVEHIALHVKRAARRIEQNRVFRIRDQAPVLHRAVADTGHGKLIEFGQRIAHPEILGEVRHHLSGDRHCVGCLSLLAFGRKNPEWNARCHALTRCKSTDSDCNQVSRHRWRRGEAMFGPAVSGCGSDARHVRVRRVRRRRPD